MFNEKEYAKRYYAKNKERIKGRSKIWRRNNPDQAKQAVNAWRKNNIERKRELNRLWAKNNPAAYKEWVKKNPYRIKANNVRYYSENSISHIIIQRVYEDNIKKYGTLTCYLCLKPILFGKDCIEHKIPYSRGGTNNYENLGVAHRSCNSKKHNKTHIEVLNNAKISR